MRIGLSAIVLVGGVVVGLAASPASAQPVRAGTLSCIGAGQTSYIIGSVTQFSCVFNPQSGRREGYVAALHRFGADIGMTTRSQLVWSVLAATRRTRPGEIAGNYAGVSAGAALGGGGTVNVLVGGANNAFTLQPIALQGSEGVNVVGGVAGMELRSVAPVRYRYRHRRR
jgi:hypothetical protein